MDIVIKCPRCTHQNVDGHGRDDVSLFSDDVGTVMCLATNCRDELSAIDKGDTLLIREIEIVIDTLYVDSIHVDGYREEERDS